MVWNCEYNHRGFPGSDFRLVRTEELSYTARSAPPPEGCNTGFSISAVTVRLNNGARFDLVNAHPASFSEECRTKMLVQALAVDDNPPSILENDRVLIMGDFNFDPWRTGNDHLAVFGVLEIKP